ncbi:B3 domain-containing protein At3g06220-like [Spinacia oleracea]|uniref:B3 domain-containing protein At3g06220-like n=1 Tax=Spinacia oleracea TaxID=3562 RepID=A0A9R0HS79_SPIOL|nr:B3 domain-containing protein At3g06220-like [Spinacia oleracea]
MANTQREWHVAIWRAKGHLYIGAGWEHFVGDLHLRDQDVLYFYYAGIGVFHVKVYNNSMEERFYEQPAGPVDVEEAAIGVEVVDVEVAPMEEVVDVENVTEEAAIGEATVEEAVDVEDREEAAIEEAVHVEDREEAAVKEATRG